MAEYDLKLDLSWKANVCLRTRNQELLYYPSFLFLDSLKPVRITPEQNYFDKPAGAQRNPKHSCRVPSRDGPTFHYGNRSKPKSSLQ